MTVAQNLITIVVFSSLTGGIGASLLLPAMQSLIHGNFEGAAQKRTYAMVGAAAAIAAAVGPLLGGFVDDIPVVARRVLLEVVIITVVLANIKLVRDVAYTGVRKIDLVGAALSVVGMGGVVLGILVWQEGGESVGALIALGLAGLAGLAYWLVRSKRQGKLTLLDPGLFDFPHFRLGISQQMLQQIALGGAMIVLPIFLQLKLEYNAMQAGLCLAPLSLSMFATADPRGEEVREPAPEQHHPARLPAGHGRHGAADPAGAPRRLRLGPGDPPLIAGTGLGLLVSQLNNYTLAPIEEERVSEAAGVNSAAGSFGLSFGLAVAGGLMLAALSLTFTDMTESSTVLPPADQERIAQVLEDDAQVMSDTQLTALLEDQPDAIRTEILSINDDARDRALQVALLVPVLAGLLGLVNAFRMMRLPDIKPVAAADGTDWG